MELGKLIHYQNRGEVCEGFITGIHPHGFEVAEILSATATMGGTWVSREQVITARHPADGQAKLAGAKVSHGAIWAEAFSKAG